MREEETLVKAGNTVKHSNADLSFHSGGKPGIARKGKGISQRQKHRKHQGTTEVKEI